MKGFSALYLGAICSFEGANLFQINSSTCSSAFRIANSETTGLLLQRNLCCSAVNMILKIYG